ncbi:cysteine dioxygenase [Amycolatopsis aidingensis]|uniref:cysteine dioxygenase n=1 Tax=Amycolatopsis aidingensis TaxID=2842453 RepID=UPI001C0B3AEA|nr:cysteine dioxygenase family protein [Amycolatopsis aidingensis]
MTTTLRTSKHWARLCPRPEEIDKDTPGGRRVRPAALRRIVSTMLELPELWSEHVRFDLGERYFARLHWDTDFEVWLICWELGQDTLLHDHGGSVGAFGVATGGLIEDHGDLRGGQLRTRTHPAGSSVAFGPDYLHNLVNISTEPAVTVHAYSRPLRRMNFYCWLPSGPHHLRELPCDSPEPDTGDLERLAARTRAARR